MSRRDVDGRVGRSFILWRANDDTAKRRRVRGDLPRPFASRSAARCTGHGTDDGNTPPRGSPPSGRRWTASKPRTPHRRASRAPETHGCRENQTPEIDRLPRKRSGERPEMHPGVVLEKSRAVPEKCASRVQRCPGGMCSHSSAHGPVDSASPRSPRERCFRSRCGRTPRWATGAWRGRPSSSSRAA